MPNNRKLHTLHAITRHVSTQLPVIETTTTTTTTTTVPQYQCMDIFLREYSEFAVARFYTPEDGEIYPPTNECDRCMWEAVDDETRKNASINNSQELFIWMTISGINSISFDWKISSKEGYDEALFIIQDLNRSNIFVATTSGEYDWSNISYNMLDNQQSYIIIWSYSKDGSVNVGDDCVYLKNLVIS